MSKNASHPASIKIKDYEYDLPDDRIARFPLKERDQSKLLIYDGNLREDSYQNISTYLPENAFLVSNQAKVIHARLHFQKPTGGKIELFCLEPDKRYPDITTAMVQKNEVYWNCLIRGASKWKEGPLSLIILENHKTIRAQAEKISQNGNSFVIRINWSSASSPEMSFSEFLEKAGKIPIPPYLKRKAEDSDEERYQTIFAKNEGSVAAPTAGLHFTERILAQLHKKGIEIGQLTLHVGAGTFMPVKSEILKEHQMHAEWIEFSLTFLQQLKDKVLKKSPVICIGTTSARTIESIYWLGVQILEKTEENLTLDQWFPYSHTVLYTPEEALEALIDYMKQNKIKDFATPTRLLIAPGYTFRFLNGLITNFHQPASTLLLMIAALVGEDWRKIYRHALAHDYRFLSYGDGCLLWKN